MRLVILSQYYPPETGAPQVRLSAMARCLQSMGHEVKVITAMPNHPLGTIFLSHRGRWLSTEEMDGILITRVWLVAAIGGGIKRMINYLSFTATAMIGLLKIKRKPDLIFVETPPPFVMLTTWLWARRHRIPIAMNIADLWPDSILEMGFIRPGFTYRCLSRLERWSYAHAHTVVAVTEGIRDTLTTNKRVPPNRVSFLPNGVDPELFAPRDPEPDLAAELGLEGRRLIVYAGTIGFAQGLDTAIMACHRLTNELPDLTLVLLGAGSDRERLEQLVHDHAITNVRFLDPRPPEFVPRLLALADAGLVSLKALPLFEGARPSKLFPIMACARPVLYSGRGEGANLVTAAQAGWCADPEDVGALVDAIRALRANPTEATERGQHGRAFVLKTLTWQRNIQDWLTELAASKGSA